MISPSFLTQFTALQTAVTAAGPIENAPLATLASLQGMANTLIGSLDSALASTDLTVVSPVLSDPNSTAAAIVAVTQAITDEVALAELRAFAGRIAVTVANVGV